MQDMDLSIHYKSQPAFLDKRKIKIRNSFLIKSLIARGCLYPTEYKHVIG